MRRGGEQQQHKTIFSRNEMSPVHCIGPMDKRTELAQKALGRSTFRYISISFRWIQNLYLSCLIKRGFSFLICHSAPTSSLSIPTLSIYQNIEGRPSRNRFSNHVHLAFRSFPPRHNSRHKTPEASETARSARFAQQFLFTGNRKIRFGLRRAGAAAVCA